MTDDEIGAMTWLNPPSIAALVARREAEVREGRLKLDEDGHFVPRYDIPTRIKQLRRGEKVK